MGLIFWRLEILIGQRLYSVERHCGGTGAGMFTSEVWVNADA